MLPWNAKGDTPTTIIMWIGAILAVGILVIWFMRVVYPTNQEADIIDSNLKALQFSFGDACISKYYKNNFNPDRLEEGVLNITNNKACVTLRRTKCTTLICNTNHSESWRLKDLAFLSIERINKTFIFTPTYLE